MSFEGYYQVLCKNGHYEAFSVYWDEPEFWKCGDCGEPCAWWHIVDVTNGSYDEEGNRIDGYVELETEKQFICVCPTCGVAHETAPARYKIPKGVGHTEMPKNPWGDYDDNA